VSSHPLSEVSDDELKTAFATRFMEDVISIVDTAKEIGIIHRPIIDAYKEILFDIVKLILNAGKSSPIAAHIRTLLELCCSHNFSMK
jgi:predicted RNA-binding protein